MQLLVGVEFLKLLPRFEQSKVSTYFENLNAGSKRMLKQCATMSNKWVCHNKLYGYKNGLLYQHVLYVSLVILGFPEEITMTKIKFSMMLYKNSFIVRG